MFDTLSIKTAWEVGKVERVVLTERNCNSKKDSRESEVFRR